MDKKKAVGFIVMFFMLTVMPHIAYLFLGEYADNDNHENRAKAPRPALAVDTYRDFPKKFESFFNDRIPFRNELIKLSTSMDNYIFSRLTSNKVLVGKDGWLFYFNKSRFNPVKQSQGYWHYSDGELKTIAENLVKTRDELKKRNIDFVFFIAPNKESVYGEYIPGLYPVKDKNTSTDQLVDYLKKNTDIKVVFPKREILAAKAKYEGILLYPKLDTHWNDLGGYFGVAELAKELGVALPGFDKIKYRKRVAPSGDLANHLNIKVKGGDDVFDVVKISDSKTERKVLDGKNFIWDFVTTAAEGEAAPDGRRVFLWGDSYRECMAPSLAPLFRNVRMVHESVFEPRQVYDYGANVFICELVERHLRLLFDFKSIYQYKPLDKK